MTIILRKKKMKWGMIMNRVNLKNEFKSFISNTSSIPMIGEVYMKFPNLTKFIIFIEEKVGIVSKPQFFRLISSIHYEYSNLLENIKHLQQPDMRDVSFQIGHQRIISNILSQIYNSIILVPIMGERDDSVYKNITSLGYATDDYFNIYFSMVKASLNYKTKDDWNRLDKYVQLLITIIATYDDEFNVNEFVKNFLTEIDKQTENKDIAQNIIFLMKFNEYVQQLLI